MSSTKKVIIGILTILPIVLFALYLIYIFSFILEIGEIERRGTISDPEDIMRGFVPVFMLILLMILNSLGMLIFYLIDITRNPKFQNGGNEKLVWILVVLFASMLGMMAYFIVEIYPRKELPPLPKD